MEVLTFRVLCCISEALGWLNETLSETKNKLKFLSHMHTLNFVHNYSVLSTSNLLDFSHQTDELLMYIIL